MRAPARWHYLLWGLVVIRLLVPAMALPHNPASLENIPIVAYPFHHGSEIMSQESVPAAAAAPQIVDVPEAHPTLRVSPAPVVASSLPRQPLSRWQWAALAWLGGALILGGWLAACATRFRRRLLRDTFPVDTEVETIWHDCHRRWSRRPPPRILAAEWIASPALAGLWRPTLLIPRHALSAFSRQDWEHVFAHEIAHLRSRDHWSQLLLLLTVCVHWFNPLVWVGLRRLRVDRELAADEWALQRLEGERALAYGETLFKTLAARPGHFFQPWMVGISEDGAQMKQRLRRITVFRRRGFYGSLAGLAALLALGAILLGQGASQTATSPGTNTAKPEEKPTTLSLQPPPVTVQDISGEILAAARAGDSVKVGELLRHPDKSFHSSSQHRAVQIVQILDDFLQKRELPAYTLVLDEILKLPIGKSWTIGDSALSSLVQDGRTDFLDVLLARGLDLNRLSQQAKAASGPTAEWITRRVAEVGRQRADIEALGKAAAAGDVPALRQLLDSGADVNGVGQDNNTPLIRAVSKDRLEAAQFLLDHGAQVDKPRFPGWDYTPLCLAHSVPMAELLKKAGANVHAKLFNRDVSILTYVATWGPPDLVAWFLQQGLDPKMIGDNNQTLLFHLKDARTAELLLAAGVDPNHVDEFGITAIATARSAEVAQKLVDHGAKVRGLPEPLLPRMVLNSSVGAIEAVLKAGGDQDPATLQRTLSLIDPETKADFPEL